MGFPARTDYGWPTFPSGRTREQERRRPSGSATRAVIFVLIFSGIAYAFWTYGRSAVRPAEKHGPASIPSMVSTAQAEDLVGHLQNALDEVSRAREHLLRSEDWTGRVMPNLDQEGFALERRRLTGALAASQSARGSLERARSELETTKNLLVERSK